MKEKTPPPSTASTPGIQQQHDWEMEYVMKIKQSSFPCLSASTATATTNRVTFCQYKGEIFIIVSYVYK